jgi:hypothetical protein
MKRWTNGLPGATKRLGAKMAFEVFRLVSLGCARIPMMARSKLLHFRGLIIKLRVQGLLGGVPIRRAKRTSRDVRLESAFG